jgi:rare lipoprotein A
VPTGPPSPGWTEEGIASWYGGRDGFEGKPTASGEIYDSSLLTAAHRELPLGTVVDVTNLDNDRTVRVRINDRGPFVFGRVIDLSRAAAERIGLAVPGTGPVRVTVVVPGVAEEAVSPSGRWAVQVGSFADRLRAERYAERLRGTGRSVFLEPYRGLSRVKVGPFDSRAEAERELDLLEEDAFEGIVVPTN